MPNSTDYRASQNTLIAGPTQTVDTNPFSSMALSPDHKDLIIVIRLTECFGTHFQQLLLNGSTTLTDYDTIYRQHLYTGSVTSLVQNAPLVGLAYSSTLGSSGRIEILDYAAPGPKSANFWWGWGGSGNHAIENTRGVIGWIGPAITAVHPSVRDSATAIGTEQNVSGTILCYYRS